MADPTPDTPQAVVTPTHPLKSKATWGNVAVIVAAFVGIGARRGWWPAELNDAITGLSLDFITGAIGVIVSQYGRWTAPGPLGLVDEKTVPIKAVVAPPSGVLNERLIYAPDADPPLRVANPDVTLPPPVPRRGE